MENDKKLDEMGTLLHELKGVMEDQDKKYDGARVATEEKLSDALLDVAELKQKMAAVEAYANRAGSELDAKTDDSANKAAMAEYKTAFVEFLRAKDPASFDMKHLKDLQVKALTGSVFQDGGVYLTPERANFISQFVFETSPIRQVANVMQVGARELQVLVDDDEATAEWVGEGATRSTTDTPETRLVTITAHELSAKPKATHAMLEDAGFDIDSWLTQKVADQFSRTENTAFCSGTGVGKPRGFLTYTAWTTPGTYEVGKIEQIVSGTSGVFTGDGLISLQTALKEPYQANAVWLLARASFGAIRKLKDGNSQYLLGLGAAGLQGNGVGGQLTILGKPAYFASDMPVIASSSLSAAYGDFKAGYTIIDRVGVSVLRDPYSDDAFVVYKTRKRVGGAVTNFDAIKLQKLST